MQLQTKSKPSLYINPSESKSLSGARRHSLPPPLSPSYTTLFFSVINFVRSFISITKSPSSLSFPCSKSSSHGGLAPFSPFFHPCSQYPPTHSPFLFDFSLISLHNPQMVSDSKDPPPNFPPRALIVGNFCHDFLIRDAHVVTQSLGGAASFISTVFDGLSVPYRTVSKVGEDFAYSTNQNPIVVVNSKTTAFRAFFDSSVAGDGHGDRILKRVSACAPILPSDLPDFRFEFGMAVGVGGEVLPETLERMIEICDVVFVDVQSLIRVFDEVDGTVEHVNLKESGFFHLLPRIGFLKASAEEAPFMDVEEVKKLCPVVVTNGKEGCKLYSNGGELQIAPFTATQLDPTGAGDSFLGGFAVGFTAGLAVPDAALLGNLFGSLTVAQIGLPRFESRILQRIKDEVERRKLQCIDSCNQGENKSIHRIPEGHEQFHKSLGTVRSECQLNLPASPRAVERVNGQHKLL